MTERILLISSVLVFAFISNSLAGTFKLPDTGQTTCYDAGKVITCPAPGQPWAQDGGYDINPLSYTDNGNGTIADNNAGLIWQRQDDGIPRTWDAENTYCADSTFGGQADCYVRCLRMVKEGVGRAL